MESKKEVLISNQRIKRARKIVFKRLLNGSSKKEDKLSILELICEELSAQALYLFSTISTGVPSSEPVKLSNARNFGFLPS